MSFVRLAFLTIFSIFLVVFSAALGAFIVDQHWRTAMKHDQTITNADLIYAIETLSVQQTEINEALKKHMETHE